MTDIQPGSIVVGADGSANADRAVRWAAEQASLEQRPLVVMTAAHQSPALVGMWPGPTYISPAAELLRAARALADQVARLAVEHRPGLEVRTAATTLDPRTELADLTARAQLLVLGSRGRGPVTSKVLGSVSASVVRRAECPVVVCRPGGDSRGRKGVLVGADGTPESVAVLDFAFRQASLRSQPLTLLHSFLDAMAAVESPRFASRTEPADEAQRRAVLDSLARLAGCYPEVQFDVEVARGYASDTLAPIADRHELVVIGHHPDLAAVERFGGAVATAVLERSHTNIAVVPQPVTG